jgi:hypothetical protein
MTATVGITFLDIVLEDPTRERDLLAWWEEVRTLAR